MHRTIKVEVGSIFEHEVIPRLVDGGIDKLVNSMKRKQAIILFTAILAIVGVIYYWIGGIPSREVVSITPLDSFILGSVDHSQGRLSTGLYPCAKDEEEAKLFVNQWISYGKCSKENKELNCNEVSTLIPDSEINEGFLIENTTEFFKVAKVVDKYDYYMGGSNNPDNYYEVPNTFYICKGSNFEYLNTAYQLEVKPYVSYPYSIQGNVFEVTDGSRRYDRKLADSYLDNPELGIAKISATKTINKKEVLATMDFLYQIGYFGLSGFNTSGRIINRQVKEDGIKWIVEDTVEISVSNDTWPFQTDRYQVINRIVVDSNTRLVTGGTKR